MEKFVLFINKGSGIDLLKLLTKNNIYPELVLTQTPYDSVVQESGIKELFINIKYLLSVAIKRKVYLKTYDVYYFCRKNKIEVLSDRFTNHKYLIERCRQLDINLGIIFTYRRILKKDIINSLSHGIINYHPSLLPRHRGGDPFFWTIYNEEKYSGITFHFIVEKIDKGVILYQKQYKIKDNESVTTLYKELLKMGEDEILYYLQTGKFRDTYLQNKDEKIEESYEKAVTEEFFLIDENSNSENIRKLFKANFSTMKPYVKIENEKIKFSSYEIISANNEFNPGNVFILNRDNNYFKIKTSDNKIIKLYK